MAHRGESYAHRVAKISLCSGLQINGLKAEPERRLDVGGRTRVADVFFEADGHSVVIELQKSSIKPEDLAKRRKDYEAIGINHVWIAVAPLKKLRRSATVMSVASVSRAGQRFGFDSDTGLIYEIRGRQLDERSPVAPSHFVPFIHEGEVFFSPFAELSELA